MGREQSDINIAKIPVSGIGGLGLVAIAVVTAVMMPELRWVAIVSVIGGVAVALTLVVMRHRRARVRTPR